MMIWGGVYWEGKTKIKIIEGNIDAKVYQRIIQECIITPQHTEWEKLLQDNAPAHVAGSTLDFLDAQGIDLVDPFPPSSPDLNPIELVWSWMKREVDKQYPTNRDQLKICIQQAWDKLPQSTIQGFISHLKTAVNRVIEKGGNN